MRAVQDRRAEECDRLFVLHHSDPTSIRKELDQQFATLHGRAQLLLGICGVLLSASVLITTGRIIGRGTYELERVAAALLAFAGMCDIAATAIIVGGVLRIQWLTQAPAEDLREWMMRAITHRDAKTRAYHVALGFAMLSMSVYQAAVLIVVLQL